MFISEQINKKTVLLSLAVSTLLYFAASRILQDILYKRWGLLRPENLFDSFGPFFARPEPLEMPLYFLGFIFIPALAYLFYRAGQWQNSRYFYWLVGLTLLFGLIYALPVLLERLPDPELYLNYVREHGAGKALWLLLTKRIFVTVLLLLVSAAVFVWVLIKKPGLAWIKKYDARLSWKLFEPLFLLLLVFLAFHPNLPTQDHHYNYFIGTLNDVFHGQPLLYETTHLYGLLNIYFLLPIMKFILPFGYASLSLVLFVFFSVFLIGLYYFLKLWLKSRLLSAFGALAATALLLFFQTSPTRSAYFFPAMTPFRFGVYLPAFFLIYFYQRSGSKWLYHLLIGWSAVAFFWSPDTGAYLSAAVFLSLWYISGFGARNFFRTAFQFLGYLAVIFGVINFINYAVYQSWPNWALFFEEITPFGAGIGMTPLPLVGLFEFFVLLYLASGLRIWRDFRKGKSHDLVFVFLVCFGVFSSLYYISESTWQNLYLVSIVPILVALYYFNAFPESRLPRAAFYAGLVFFALLLTVKLPVELGNRDYQHPRNLSAEAAEDKRLYADALYLKEHFPAAGRLALLHLKDTELLFLADKANWFDFYFLFNLYYEEDIDALIVRVQNERPQHLFIGKEKNDQIDYFASRALQGYNKKESLRTLDIYKLTEK